MSGDEREPSGDEHGITDEDMEQIIAFAGKRRFERSAEDLRRSSTK
ncbi:hypothetical protein [Halobacterium yunchengense]